MKTALILAALWLAAPVVADELKVPVGQQGMTSMNVPKSGMTKEAVEQKFGAPESRKGPVGEPPITIWKYGSYSVYFEYDKVIHTVKHKTS